MLQYMVHSTLYHLFILLIIQLIMEFPHGKHVKDVKKIDGLEFSFTEGQ